MTGNTSSGAFGNRSVGGMVGSGSAGSFGGGNQIVTGQAFNIDSMNAAGVNGIGSFSAQSFVGGAGAANGFIGGLAGRGINANQNGMTQAGGMNGQRGGQFGAGQYGGGQFGGGMNGQFGGGMNGQQNNRNNRQNQLANGQNNGRSRSEMPIQTTFTIGFPTPSLAPSAVSTKLSSQLSSSHSIAAEGPVTVQL